MGVAKLKKAELYYHKSVHEEIAAALQDSGVCQIINAQEAEGGTRPSDIEARLAESEERLADVRYLMRALTPHFNDPVPSLDRMLGEKPVMSMSELSQLAHDTDLSGAAQKVRGLEHELGEVRLELSQARANQALLANYSFFPYELAVITEGTRVLAGAAGVVKSEQLEAFKNALNNFAKDTEVFFSNVSAKTPEVYVVVLYSRDKASQVLDACVKNGMSMAEVPAEFKGSLGEEKAKNAELINKLEAKDAELVNNMKKLADEYMPNVQKLSDYWTSLVSRWQALSESGETESVLYTKFWLPAKETEKVRGKIEAISPNVALSFADPEDGEEPPTMLTNGNLVRPFNILTELYSPPKYKGIDPTPLLAPFFFVFFGMCLGDAGYAIVMGAAIYWLFKKYKRIPLGIKDFVTLFAFSAVSTFIYGIISGSFFGNFIDAFLPFLIPVKNAFMLVDPMTNPMQVLGISLLFGVVHLMFGLLISAYEKLKENNYFDAIGADISWFLLIVGLCLFGTGAGGMLPAAFGFIGKWMAIIGAVIIFVYSAWTKEGNIFSKIISGFLALYGSTSYLGDILSYSRLLALGFGSAVIGMIINLLGGMAANIPYIGWLIGIVVVAGGHLFSVLINLLGAFVHPLRLQYVEFFGKFYTGGGEPFTPLKNSEEFVSVKA